jgi:hypothetical protein
MSTAIYTGTPEIAVQVRGQRGIKIENVQISKMAEKSALTRFLKANLSAYQAGRGGSCRAALQITLQCGR